MKHELLEMLKNCREDEQLDKEFISLYKKKDGSNLSKLRTLKPKSIRYVKRLQLLEKQA